MHFEPAGANITVSEPFDLTLNNRASGIRLQVLVKPRSSRSAILGVRNGALVVALAAPPVEGEANKELVRLLAAAAGIPKTSVTLASGASSKTKLIDFAGIDTDQLKSRLTTSAPRTGRK